MFLLFNFKIIRTRIRRVAWCFLVDILANLKLVQQKITEVALRCGRQPGSVQLLVVTKTIPVEQVAMIINAGVDSLGESRVQELLKKQQQFPGIKWHFIGHLQTNKVKQIIDKVFLIHALDRWSLAETINRFALAKKLRVNVLIQVNISGETSKYGLAPAKVAEFIAAVAKLPGISVQGLMTMAPLVKNQEQVRGIFKALKMMRQKLITDWPNLKILSMGMSNDFEVAVEEGADIVRVGSTIFH